MGCAGVCAQAREREAARAGSDGERAERGRRAAAEEREAEARRAMREGEGRLRERIARLDADNQDLRRRARPSVPSIARSMTGSACNIAIGACSHVVVILSTLTPLCVLHACWLYHPVRESAS
jgi:hypothetical protein